MEISNLKQNVDRVHLNGKDIYLVGTAHISQASVQLAEETIREINPDSVAVELCDSRYQSLRDPERWKNTDIVSVIRSGKTSVLAAQLVLASFQKRLGSKLEVKPGAEMIRAVQVADELGKTTVLADRDVRTTLKRVWGSLGFWQGAKLIMTLILSSFSKTEISADEIEKLKSEDTLQSLLKELGTSFPNIQSTLIDERDRYLAAKIREAPGKSVVAVIGAGHVPGIKSYLDKEIDLAPLEKLPPPGKIGKIIGWSIPLLVIGLLLYTLFWSGLSASARMLESWFWITGFMGALGAAVAVAHPITVLAAFFGTPLATLHPLIAAGWIAGLVEAWLRKPTVADFESITDDITTLKGLWTNRVSRIILVIAFTNIFATIGMIWGTKVVASLAIIGNQ